MEEEKLKAVVEWEINLDSMPKNVLFTQATWLWDENKLGKEVGHATMDHRTVDTDYSLVET